LEYLTRDLHKLLIN